MKKKKEVPKEKHTGIIDNNFDISNPRDEVCDHCGKKIHFDYAFVSIFEFNIREDHPEYNEILKEYGKTDFRICYMCFLERLGVNPKQ